MYVRMYPYNTDGNWLKLGNFGSSKLKGRHVKDSDEEMTMPFITFKTKVLMETIFSLSASYEKENRFLLS